jgi:uncharacterized protein (DUF58 family)
MSITKFIKDEAKELLIVTLFFLSGFLLILGLFELMLEDYGIHFNAWIKAVVAALVLVKVVLILRDRAFMQAFPNYYGIVRVLYKTIIYLVGVFVVITFERVVEAYGDAGGFLTALKHVAETRKIYHVMAVTLLVGVLLAAFNCWEELLREVGRERLVDAFFRKKNFI